jgi:hypothetical protein
MVQHKHQKVSCPACWGSYDCLWSTLNTLFLNKKLKKCLKFGKKLAMKNVLKNECPCLLLKAQLCHFELNFVKTEKERKKNSTNCHNGKWIVFDSSNTSTFSHFFLSRTNFIDYF